MCVLCSRLLFPYLVRFRSLLVHSFQVCVICEGVFKSCLLYSMLSGLLVIPGVSTRHSRCFYSSFPVFLLVIPGVSTLPCLPLMLSLKTIILKYFLVCVFLVSPCCVHRDNTIIVYIKTNTIPIITIKSITFSIVFWEGFY